MLISIEQVHQWTGTAVDLAVLAGAIAAAIRFRIFHIFGRRWTSDVRCFHTTVKRGMVIFVAEYIITNTGRRPLRLESAEMRLVPAHRDGSLLVPDEKTAIAERAMRATDPRYTPLFTIEPGERTIFTLRCQLPRLDETVFILCSFSLIGNRRPAAFSGFYVKRRNASLHGPPIAISDEPPPDDDQ